jgi:hypothetical protein
LTRGLPSRPRQRDGYRPVPVVASHSPRVARNLQCGRSNYFPPLGVRQRQEGEMARNLGDRYICDKCGAVLVYEKGCPCPDTMPHSEICCGQQMQKVTGVAPTAPQK